MRRSRAIVDATKLTLDERSRFQEAYVDETLTFGRNDGNNKNTGLFAAIPSWWRGFLFHLLGPADLAIYLYLLMMCDEKQVCSPTDRDIADATGISSRDTINRARNRLVRMGLMLCQRIEEYSGRRYQQYAYRRPPYEYTIKRLLELGAIDERLIARNSKLHSENPALFRGVQAAIAHGLKKFFSLDQLNAYLNADTKGVRLERLHQLLDEAHQRRSHEQPMVDVLPNITTRQNRRRRVGKKKKTAPTPNAKLTKTTAQNSLSQGKTKAAARTRTSESNFEKRLKKAKTAEEGMKILFEETHPRRRGTRKRS